MSTPNGGNDPQQEWGQQPHGDPAAGGQQPSGAPAPGHGQQAQQPQPGQEQFSWPQQWPQHPSGYPQQGQEQWPQQQPYGQPQPGGTFPPSGPQPQQPWGYPQQQQWPQQPYGQPYGQPPAGYPAGFGQFPPGFQPEQQQKSKAPLIIGIGVLVVLVAVVLVLGFIAPGFFYKEKVFDAAAVEQGVEQILTQEGVTYDKGSASCPEDQPVRPDYTFSCTVTVDGKEKEVPIKVIDAEADPPKYQVGTP